MMQCCHQAYFACTLVWQVISVANVIFILHGCDQDILWLDLIGGRKKVASDFSRSPNCPTCKHGKCMNYKWCSSTEFLIHQMASPVTLAAS